MFNSWIERGAELRAEFLNAEPFPLLVIDDFLVAEFADGLLAEFPKPEGMPKSRDYMFGDKRELSSVPRQGPTSRAFYEAILSDDFRDFISVLTDKELFIDPAFHGGGFHQSGDGGYLDPHVDFNVHPLHADWLRTLNILLYLNKDWRPGYDGRLLLRRNLNDEPRAIEPLFNRAVIMVTDDSTWHGFRKMDLPPGITRKSIAAYAYQKITTDAVSARTTGWAPENGRWKRFIARHYNTAVRTKNRILGSGTARNR